MSHFFHFVWPSVRGVLPVTQLGYTIQFSSDEAEVKYTEGLADYDTFDVSWEPSPSDLISGNGMTHFFDVTVSNYKCWDSKTGKEVFVEEIKTKKSFRVDERGVLIEILNIEELVNAIERLSLQATVDSSQVVELQEKGHMESYFKNFVEATRNQTRLAAINEVSLLWTALVQAWIDVPTILEGNAFFKNHVLSAGKDCVQLVKTFINDPEVFRASVQEQLRHSCFVSFEDENVFVFLSYFKK